MIGIPLAAVADARPMGCSPRPLQRGSHLLRVEPHNLRPMELTP
jgi:hypothetical protein